MRNADDEGMVTGLFARVGKWSGESTKAFSLYDVGPVNIALGAHFATYEEVIEQLNLNQEQREALWKKVLALGPGKRTHISL